VAHAAQYYTKSIGLVKESSRKEAFYPENQGK
jgi:hypothetical protein